ncbi:MAG TPA: hypothetical protein VLY63_12125, partial [Anaerolineae bacterium]|nr:hypothetical protein [Anaerolineae bacterium]
VEDRQDALLNVWITAWDGHQLLNDPLHLFDANIFHPYSRTLAYSELLLGNAVLALPITAAAGNPVLGYNVALLLSFVLSGFGTYLLVLKLTRASGAGLVAGVIFSFSSYRMTNLAQAQLLTTQWLPFALLSLVQLMQQPRPRHVVTFVLFFCLQALSSFYYAILLVLAVVGFVIWSFVFSLRSKPASSSGGRRVSASVHLLVAAVCCALIILPFALPYFQVQRDLGFERTLADNEPFSASLRQYLMVAPGSVVHGRWLPSDDTPIAGGYPVDALFPGLVAVVLAGWGLVRGQDRTRWFFLLLMLASFILSLGPRLYLAPGQPAGLDLNLPYAWLYASVPGFKALRAPVRFDALVMLSLAALAGYGMAALVGNRQQVARGKGWRSLLVAGCLLLVALGSLVWPAAMAEPVPVGAGVPLVYRWLADQPSERVLELPMAFTPGGPQLEYQYLSTYHWQTTPDGYSGFIPPKHGQIAYEMERFPSERSVSLLQALGVHHVVVHADRYDAAHWLEIQDALSQATALALVDRFGSDQVFGVRSRSFDPGSLAVRAYLPPQAAAGEPYTIYVIASNRNSRSYAVQPTDKIQPVVAWQGSKGEMTVRATGDVPLVTSPHGGAAVIPLPLMAPTTSGTYEMTISEQNGPLGTWEAGGFVEVGDVGEHSFPIPARLEGWDVPLAVRPGDSLPVGLTWRALGKIDAYYSVYVKLLDAEANPIAGWDGQPRNGDAPTLLWVPGQAIDDTVTLSVPENTPSGEYVVEVGMYRAGDLARALTLDGEGAPLDRVILGTVRVGP